MHPRHRSPGNGYRYSSMGMNGIAAASRMSPDGAVRSHVMYNNEYRSYNRGFGRGQPKPFQPPQPPIRKGDVFMEAGRLATEYLASKGLLPQDVFSGNWKNGSLKKQVGSFQGFRPQNGDTQAVSSTSAFARLGDTAVNDVGAGSKRRFPDDYNAADPRNYMRARRRMESLKSFGSEWNQESGRSGSWSEKTAVSTDKDGKDDSIFGYQEEQQVSKNSGSAEQKSQFGEIVSANITSGNSESPFLKNQLPDDVASKASSSSTGKDLPLVADVEPTEKPEYMEISSVGTGNVKDDGCDNEMENRSATEDLLGQNCAEDDPANKNGIDLLRHCTFAKVPTKTRTSLTIKGSKMGPVSITEGENTNGSGISLGSGAPVEDLPYEGSSVDNQSLKILDPAISEATPKEDAGELALENALGHVNSLNSISFPEKSNQQESSERPPGFGRCSTVDTERGEKRAIDHSGSRDVIEKTEEWGPTIDTQADNCFQTSHERRNSPGKEGILVTDQKLPDITLSPNGVAEPCIEYAEEKQLFPGSFKICDLNLLEASDPNENHDTSPNLIFPSLPDSEKEGGHVDIDLSISNSCNVPDKFCTREADGKEVELIDLESDSAQNDTALNNQEQKEETLFTGLESFTNNAQNVNDIPDGQDGYGLMISELLGADMPNCSSVQPDANSLQNEMGLNNGEGILGDDDSIYMSLGEIPISFLRIWEQQPTQEYGKPF